MTFAAVGSLIDVATSSFSLTPHAVGDLILITVRNVSNNTVTVTGVSSSNVAWTQMGTSFAGTTTADTQAVFAGKVTSTSTATVTVSWSGTTPTMRIDGQEFSSTVGSWMFVAQGTLDVAGTNTWASLTAKAGDLYFGTCYDTVGAVAGSTTGFTYVVDSHGNGVAYDANCSAGNHAPVWGDSTMAFGTMLLVRESVIDLIGQAGIAGGNYSTPASISYVSAANNTLIITGHFYNNNDNVQIELTGITDSAGNLWQFSTSNAQTPPTSTVADPTDGASAYMTDFIAWCVGAAAVTQVTLAFTTGVSPWIRATLSEWANVASFSNSWAGGSATAASTATLGPVNLPVPGCLVVGSVDFGGSSGLAVPSGWTAFTEQGSVNDQGYYLAGATTGSYSPVWSDTSHSGAWTGAVAVFTPVIAYNTGATANAAGVASVSFTIPTTGGLYGTGVNVGDVMLLDVQLGSSSSSAPALSFSGGGGGWTLVPMTDGSANPANTSGGGWYNNQWAYQRVATAADIGATITITETGITASLVQWVVALAAYTGANQLNPIDRAGSAGTIIGTGPGSLTLPSETARIAADWAVYLCSVAGSSTISVTGPAGSVQRQSIADTHDNLAAIYDLNSPTGLNSVGGTFSTTDSSIFLSGFTILLAPAGIYVVQATSNSATTLSFAAGVTAGNTVVANVVQYGAPNPASSSPTMGGSAVTGTFLAQHQNDTSNSSYDLWVMPNCPNGVTAFACTFSNFINSLFLYEVLGLGPTPVLDQSASIFQAAGTTDLTHETAGPVAATRNGPEIAFAGCASYSGGLSAFDSAWTTQISGGNHGAAGYQFLSYAGATPQVTVTTDTISSALGLVTLAVSLPSTGTPVYGFGLMMGIFP